MEELTQYNSNPVEEVLVQQMNHELQNSLLYTNFANICDLKSLLGFQKHFDQQAADEMGHYNLIRTFLCDRNMFPRISSVGNIDLTMDISIEDICRQVMELERATTESLYNCKKVAIEEGNLMVIDFLDKLILEQIEEEASSQDIFQRVAMCNGNPVGILLLDNQF